MSALENLVAVKIRADSRANLDNFIAGRRVAGWSETCAEYAEAISVLMGNDDAAALALFPTGAYQTAAQAREDAHRFWASN